MAGATAAFLDGFTIKSPMEYQGLTVFPVCRTGGAAPEAEDDMITLEEGIKGGRAHVLETGRMETVEVRNLDALPLLIMDGETVVGGAQNRMLHTAAAVWPGEGVEMPSSCVELRRWDMKSGEKPPPEKSRFTRCDVAFASLRRLRMEEIERSLTADNRIRVDQRNVWRAIVERFGASGVKTKTLDLHDLYDAWDAALRLVVARFHLVPAQTGMIVFLDRDEWFMDVFSSRGVMMKQYRKILKAIAFEMLIRLEEGKQPQASRRPKPEHARAALRAVRTASETPTPDGRNRFLSSPKCFGFAAVRAGEAICLSACSRLCR